jgi:uncharacterized protein YidB (DUF937 family)
MGGMLGALGGLMGGGAGSSPIGAIVNMIAGQSGGLGGLVSNMTQGGLGNIVNSWIGTGQNLPITPAQVGSAFSVDQIT